MNGAHRFIIVGDGLAAWMTADALAETLGPAAGEIRVVPSPCDDAAELDATTPGVATLLPGLDIDEERLVAEDALAFTFGIVFDGWADREKVFFQPFGTIGAPIGPAPFYQLVLGLRHREVSARLADYSIAALGAQAGRFTRPPDDQRSVLSTARYGLHVDSAILRRYLKASASERNVEQTDGQLESVKLTEDGAISAVITDKGQLVDGDFFIDCTGDERRLISRINDGRWIDWSDWLPCDRVARTRISANAGPVPYSQAAAHESGWLRILPLAKSAEFQLTYQGDSLSDDRAAAYLAERCGKKQVPQVGTLRFGRLDQPWQRNCVALGSAAAIVDPIMATQLDVLRSSIDRLLGLLPAVPDSTPESREYNRRASLELDNVRDFAILPYKLNGRSGEALWDACRAMSVPETLEYKLQTFASRGIVSLGDEDRIEDVSWISMLDELDITPRTHSQLVRGLDTRDVEAHLERIRALMIDEVRRMPVHGDYLAHLKQRAVSPAK